MTGPNCPSYKLPNTNLNSNANGPTNEMSKKSTSTLLPSVKPTEIKQSYLKKQIRTITFRFKECEQMKHPSIMKSNKI